MLSQKIYWKIYRSKSKFGKSLAILHTGSASIIPDKDSPRKHRLRPGPMVTATAERSDSCTRAFANASATTCPS